MDHWYWYWYLFVEYLIQDCFLPSVFADVQFLPDGLSYYPILYFNDYWNLNQDYMPLNSSTKSVSSPQFLSILHYFLKLNICNFLVNNLSYVFWVIVMKMFYRILNLTLLYAPLSMFRWQMYAAQGMRNRWYSVLGDDFIESSDEDQDSLKVGLLIGSCLLR